MSDRPSDGMGLDELRDEFDWMFEFDSRMAELIRGDADVHSLADYVGKLEVENDKLRELIADVHEALRADKAGVFHGLTLASMEDDMRKLGIEVDDGQQRDV